MNRVQKGAICAWILCALGGCSSPGTRSDAQPDTEHDAKIATDVELGAQDSNPSPNLFGDWFWCTDPTCNEVEASGWRFQPDGIARELYGEHKLLGPNDTYCYTTDPKLVSTFVKDGNTLEITDGTSGRVDKLEFSITGDKMYTLGVEYVRKWVWPPRDSKGPCAKNIPWVCPVWGMGGLDGKCEWLWTCDNGQFMVECSPPPRGQKNATCNCILSDATVAGTFTHAAKCADDEDTIVALHAAANAACGWHLWTPPSRYQ